jgi:hypothetical protein
MVAYLPLELRFAGLWMSEKGWSSSLEMGGGSENIYRSKSSVFEMLQRAPDVHKKHDFIIGEENIFKIR